MVRGIMSAHGVRTCPVYFSTRDNLPVHLAICVNLYAYNNNIIITVKPLYSEQSRDPNKCSLYGGVHPRGVRYVHAHMFLKYNVHVHILKLTSQIYLIFGF